MGLPLSLADTGAVLGLERQKLSEGKDLIRYFCKPCEPTKTNGGRTRNRPGDAPEKWEMFKAYNLRDVETEMEIEQRLARFPVPEDVWDQFHIVPFLLPTGIDVQVRVRHVLGPVEWCVARLILEPSLEYIPRRTAFRNYCFSRFVCSKFLVVIKRL